MDPDLFVLTADLIVHQFVQRVYEAGGVGSGVFRDELRAEESVLIFGDASVDRSIDNA